MLNSRVPLTCVIVSYQCREPLLRCLASLQRQVGVSDLRVVVVDNASTDGTVEAVRRLFPDTTVVANRDNVGFGAAANQGLGLTTSGPVLVLNPDTEVPPHALATCLTRLDELPTVGMLGCKLVRADGSIDRASRRNVPTPANSLMYMTRLERLLGPRDTSYNPPLALYELEGEAGALCGAFMLVRREALEKVGGFDEAFWMYGEDLDWSVRFRQAGWGVHYFPSVAVLHLKGGSSGSIRSLRVTYAFAHAMWVFFDKHRPAGTSPVVLLGVRLGIVAHFLVAATRSVVVRHVRRRTDS
jgi:GT2 family glycosyltransferase